MDRRHFIRGAGFISMLAFFLILLFNRTYRLASAIVLLLLLAQIT